MRTFTKEVFVPVRNEGGIATIGAENVPAMRSLGTFSFREPTYRDRATIRQARDRLMAESGGLDNVSEQTWDHINFLTNFPRQFASTPDGFDLDALSDDEAKAIYEAFASGLPQVSSKN